MEIDFNKLFYALHTAMKINGSHYDIEKNKRWLLLVIGTKTLNFIIFMAIMYDVKYCMNNKDFAKLCKDGTLAIVYIVITFQFWILILKKDFIKSLFRTVKKDYEKAKLLKIDDQKIVLQYALQGQYVIRQWIVISICAAGTFLVKNIFLFIYYYTKNEFRLVPLYDIIYPSFIEERKDDLPVFILLYLLFAYLGTYSGFMYVSFVPLGPTFMLHACGKLDLLTKRIETIFEGERNVIAELRSIIIDLQEIYSFVDEIKETYRMAYYLTFSATSIILPVTVYEVIEAFHQGEVSLEIITFIVGGVLISSSPCYYSEMLMEKGNNFQLAVYSCGWEKMYDRRIRSILSLLMLRASQPVAIRTLFRTVCLDALADIFHQSYAIFNLMNAMWN